MCMTAGGLQLARVVVTDEQDAVLLDHHVRPERPVIDYLTQYSGVTPAALARARLTMAEVQRLLADLLDGVDSSSGGGSGTSNSSEADNAGGAADPVDAAVAAVASSSTTSSSSSSGSGGGSLSGRRHLQPAFLVAHSAESDLNALRLVHSRVIDTAVAYRHPAGLPYRHALRHLSRVHLSREIQAGHGGTGHSPQEDAIATMHLVQRLVYNGAVGEKAAAMRDALPAVPSKASAPAAASAAASAGPSKPADAAAQADEDGGAGVSAAGAAAAPKAKRPRSDSEGVSAAGAAASAPSDAGTARPKVPSFAAAFARPARPDYVPSTDGDGPAWAPRASAAAPAVSGTAAADVASGAATAALAAAAAAVAGTITEGEATAATTADGTAAANDNPLSSGAPASGPAVGGAAAPAAGGRGRGGAAGGIFASEAGFSEPSTCAGITVIGSPSFVGQHVSGPASGISRATAPTARDCAGVLEAVGRETARIAAGRASGRFQGLGLIVAEMSLPVATDAGAAGTGAGAGAGSSVGTDSGRPRDWAALDTLLGRADEVLAPGSGVILVCQGDLGGDDGVSEGAVTSLVAAQRDKSAALADILTCANPAAYGVAFFHATNRPQAAAQAGASAAQAAGAAGAAAAENSGAGGGARVGSGDSGVGKKRSR